VILVTGATGFVGAEVLRRASARGWRVRGLSRRPERAEQLGRLPHVELFRGDVSDPGDLEEAMEGVVAVVHLVGIIAPTRHQSFERAHVRGTEAVLEAIANAGVQPYVDDVNLGFSVGANAVDNVVGASNDRSGQFQNSGSQSLADEITGASTYWTQNQAEELVWLSEQAGVNTADPDARRTLTNVAERTGDGASSPGLTLDGNEAGAWNQEARGWVVLDNSYINGIKQGLRVARKQAAPELIRVPLLAATRAGGES